MKVCLLLTWLQSSWKPLEVYIFEMGVNRKFDFRQFWKFCWDLSNVISGGNRLFRWGCFFRCNFVPLCELWVQTKNKLTLRPWPLLIVKPHNWSSFQEHQDETYPQETWREFHRPPHLSPHLHHKRNYQAKRIKKNDFKSKLSNVQAWTNCAPDFLRAYILPHKKRKTLSICKFSVA